MTATILDGKQLASEIRKELSTQISSLPNEHIPTLAVILVGDNEASKIYVRNKKKAAAEIGMECEVIELASSIGENALLEVIHELNDSPHINGIIVQLPLPAHLDTHKIVNTVAVEKDVDGFRPHSP